jgi:hypothetical protein
MVQRGFESLTSWFGTMGFNPLNYKTLLDIKAINVFPLINTYSLVLGVDKFWKKPTICMIRKNKNTFILVICPSP